MEDGRIPANITNHCPFGCEAVDLDDYGYCQHLVGFSNDGKVMEQVKSHPKTKERFVDGRSQASVLKGDILINPEHKQLVDGVERMSKSWVSARVYRPEAPAVKKAS